MISTPNLKLKIIEDSDALKPAVKDAPNENAWAVDRAIASVGADRQGFLISQVAKLIAQTSGKVVVLVFGDMDTTFKDAYNVPGSRYGVKSLYVLDNDDTTLLDAGIPFPAQELPTGSYFTGYYCLTGNSTYNVQSITTLASIKERGAVFDPDGVLALYESRQPHVFDFVWDWGDVVASGQKERSMYWSDTVYLPVATCKPYIHVGFKSPQGVEWRFGDKITCAQFLMGDASGARYDSDAQSTGSTVELTPLWERRPAVVHFDGGDTYYIVDNMPEDIGVDAGYFVLDEVNIPPNVPTCTRDPDYYMEALGWTQNIFDGPVVAEFGGTYKVREAQTYLSVLWKKTPKPASVSFEAGTGHTGEVLGLPATASGFVVGDAYTLPSSAPVSDYARDRFLGWAASEGGAVAYQPGDEITVPHADTRLYAVWDEAPWATVKFNKNVSALYTNKVKNMPSNVTAAAETWFAGQTVTLDKSPTYDGHVFSGWSTPTKTSEPIIAPGGQWAVVDGATLYARWDVQSGEGGVVSPSEAEEDVPAALTFKTSVTGKNASKVKNMPEAVTVDAGYIVGDSIRPSSEPTYSPYTFLGWGPSGGGPIYLPGEDVYFDQETTSLYAKWGSEYAFDANGGAGEMRNLVQFYVPECGFEPPAGKRFASWNTAADGSGTQRMPGDRAPNQSGVTTLYAIWEDVPDGE